MANADKPKHEWHFEFEGVTWTGVQHKTDASDASFEVKFMNSYDFTDETINAAAAEWSKLATDSMTERLTEFWTAAFDTPIPAIIPESTNRVERMLNRKRKLTASVIRVEAKKPL